MQKKNKMSTVPSGTRFIGIATNVNLVEKKSALINSETQPFTIEDIADTVGIGAQGPQGVQGPAGPIGPVGPAGLEWQGEWSTENTYVLNDAVGFNGASWFCILEVGPSEFVPETDTTHWALLASQGAQGPQGVQGPTGPQGLPAISEYKSYVGILQFSSDGTPDETLVFSNIVDGISYTQTGTGIYELASTGKFTANKTIITPFAYQGSTTNSGAVRLPIYSSNVIVGYYWLQRTSTNTVLLNIVNASQTPINPYTLLGERNLSIEIKIYA